MMFTEGGLQSAVLHEAKPAQDTNSDSQLITNALTFDRINHQPEHPIFWGIGTLAVGVLHTSPKVVTPILCVGAHQSHRFGVTIAACPQAVVFNASNLVASEVRFAKDTNSRANKDLDYISSVLVYKRPMMKLIPMYPIQAEYITDLFDENNSHKSVRELTTLFKNRTGEQDKFFQNWLRVAAVAKDFTLTNNADSTSQLQLGPGLPHAFTLDHSEDIYADLRTGFKDNNQEFGTTVANGVLNCLSKEFDPALKEIVDVDAAREVRQRTGTSPGVTTTNDSTLDAVLQRNLQLEEQLAQRQRFAALATSRQQAQTTARIANGNVSFEGTRLPFSNKINQFSGNGFSKKWLNVHVPATSIHVPTTVRNIRCHQPIWRRVTWNSGSPRAS